MDDFSDKSAKSYSYLRATAIEQAAVYDGQTNERVSKRVSSDQACEKVQRGDCTVHSLAPHCTSNDDLTSGRTTNANGIVRGDLARPR